jgi:hypothetical protein
MIEAAQDTNFSSKIVELPSSAFDHFDGDWLPV